MEHVVENSEVRELFDLAWLRDAQATFDVPATLTSALNPLWTVHREQDPDGDLSIVVLPFSETAALPTFILYERDGMVQVSTFHGDDWHCRRTFRTCRRAVAAIIAAAAPDRVT